MLILLLVDFNIIFIKKNWDVVGLGFSVLVMGGYEIFMRIWVLFGFISI